MKPVLLGPFALIEPLARGGSGEVWRGRHEVQRTPVAIKLLKPEIPLEDRYLQRFREEVRAAARLDHPAIATVLDYGSADGLAEERSAGMIPRGTPWLAMELATGGSLDRMIPERWAQVRAILVAVLDGLAHAHARGVIHRDIKPGNVLLCRPSDMRPGPKLTDLGIAHAIDANRPGRRLAGTRHYMAPEQIRGKWRDFGPWTDLYALGCMAWRLTTGKVPFHGLRGEVLSEAQCLKDPPPYEPRFAVPPGFRLWLQMCMAKETAARFQRAADAARALRVLPSLPGDAEIDGIPLATRPVCLGDDALPVDWRRPIPAPAPMRLVGAGLGLFGLRVVPLVGRERERDTIWKAIRGVGQSGRPAAVVVTGVGGTGKSRLVEWMCQRAHELGGVEVLSATHGPLSSSSAALRDMVRSHLRTYKQDRARIGKRVRRIAPSIADADALTELVRPATQADIDAGARPVHFTSPAERDVVVANYLRHAASQRVALVWLDDVQWGPDALRLVRHVLDEGRGRIVFLLTARQEALAERPAERQRLEALQSRDDVASIELGPLPPKHGAQLVRGLLGLAPQLAAQVEERVGGNPLFAVQLIGDWVTRGVLRVSESGFVLSTRANPILPRDLHVVWRQRVFQVLDDLPAGAVVDLEMAAALGTVVDAREWDAVRGDLAKGRHRRQLLLERLLALHLAVAVEEGWSFVHGILRETVQRMAEEAGRWRSHHRACAEMVRTRYAGAEGSSERLGRHLLEAGRLDEAVDHILAGVADRQIRLGYRPSLSLLGDADKAMKELRLPLDDARWGELWLVRSVLSRLQGEYDAAWRQAQRTVDAAREHGWDAALPRALNEKALILLHRRQLEEGEAVLDEAIALAEARDDDETLGASLYLRAAAKGEQRDFDGAAAIHAEAVRVFRKVGDEVGVADCWRDRANHELARRNIDEAERLYRAALAIYSAHGRRLGMAHASNGLAEVARKRGDLAAAETGYRDALDLFDAIGAGQAVVPRLNLGMVLLQRGDLEASRPPLERALAILEAQERVGFLGAAHAVLLPSLAAGRAWADWDHSLEHARDLLRRSSLLEPDVAFATRLAGDEAADAGELLRARAAWRLSLEQYEGLGRDDDAATVAQRLGRHRDLG